MENGLHQHFYGPHHHELTPKISIDSNFGYYYYGQNKILVPDYFFNKNFILLT